METCWFPFNSHEPRTQRLRTRQIVLPIKLGSRVTSIRDQRVRMRPHLRHLEQKTVLALRITGPPEPAHQGIEFEPQVDKLMSRSSHRLVLPMFRAVE